MTASPANSDRVRALLARMTLEEKLAQLVGFWVDQGTDVVAPMADEMAGTTPYEAAIVDGIGHLTRVYGTRPVDPLERAHWLWGQQRHLLTQTRLGIPAIVHEECLTGLAAWKAAAFPTPLAWGASFDPKLVERMGEIIGTSMRQLGIHQGLAPVLDVVRDPRWGRVDECIAEDPYVVGTIGTAYVRGLQSTGVDATLKHFVGYSASQAGRNHAPTHIGPRELADVFLPPFEMAVREGGARSVMNSYAEIDGVPVASTPAYLTQILRDDWGFDGVIVADYFAVAFLETMHAVAADRGEAAALALGAGIDVELPTGDAYLAPLAERVRSGVVPEASVDAAVLRVLGQKERLGLLDETFETPPTAVDLDTPEHREIARLIAEQSIVLLSNDGVLPLATPARIAVIGPNADSPEALMGCYSFANHVLSHHPDVEMGFDIPTVLEAIGADFPESRISFTEGCAPQGDDVSGLDEASTAASAADVAIVVVGDRAGLFGRGTVGEGNDVESLELPGVQRTLIETVVATGTPTIVIVLSGRPYAIGWALDGASPASAVLQSFFPGEEGAAAIASILAGRVNPSGRLPISLPRSAGAQPFTYLHPLLGGPSGITSSDSTPVRPFGFGLSYTTFAHDRLEVDSAIGTDREFTASVRVRNTGSRAGADVVQLYFRDVAASVTRPVAQLVAYERLHLDAGEESIVTFTVPPSRLSFVGRSLERIVEPGSVEFWVGASSADRDVVVTAEVVGDVHTVAPGSALLATATVR